MKTKFYITDVFAIEKYTGNQLATFIDSAHLSSEEMQKMAAETNFSETTFVSSPQEKNGAWDVRIFTPKAEIDFAGHPTLGTAFIINRFLKPEPADEVILNLKVGRIPVSTKGPILWMKQVQPTFADVPSNINYAELLSLDSEDIDLKSPLLEVYTGLPFTIVPVKKLKALKKAKVNQTIYQEFLKVSKAKGILVFSTEGYHMCQDLSVRVFVDYLGIPEDPATGSANGCLAAYLLKTNYLKSQSIDVVAGQGIEICRPSELFLRASLEKNNYSIEVGGRVIEIAEGFWG